METRRTQQNEILLKLCVGLLSVCFAVIGFFLIKTMDEIKDIKKATFENTIEIIRAAEREKVIIKDVEDLKLKVATTK